MVFSLLNKKDEEKEQSKGVFSTLRDARRQQNTEARIQNINDGIVKDAVPSSPLMPTLQREFPSQKVPLPSPVDMRKDWVDQRLESDRKGASGNKITSAINTTLEPISRAVYSGASHVAPLVQGAGQALGIKADTAQYNPTLGNKAMELGGAIAGSLTNPTNLSQGIASLGYRSGSLLAQRVGQSAPALNNRFAQSAIQGASAGAAQGALISGVRGETDPGEFALNVGLGAALGGAGDAALAGIGQLARNVVNKYRPQAATPVEPTLGLPAPRQRGNTNAAATDGVITPEYTWQLPEPNPSTTNRLRNVDEGRQELKVLDDEIRRLEADYERAIVEEYNFLKQSLDNRGGVQQGQLIPGQDGDVAGRVGRISNNPRWYQDYYSQHGRVPSNKELFRLARERVDNGFMDDAGEVPGWKAQNNFDEMRSTLQGVRDTIQQSIRELDPAIKLTDSPIVSNELSFTPAPRAQRQEVPMPQAPEVSPQQLPEFNPTIRNLPEANADMGISLFGKSNKPVSPEDTRQYIRSNTERDPIDASKVVDDFYTKYVDDLQRINDLDKGVEKLLGRKLKPEERSYYKALNTRGSDVIAKHILTERLVDSKGNALGQSLKDIMSQIPSGKQNYKNFTDYLIARHAVTRMNRNEKVYNKKANMSAEKAAQKVAQYEQSYPVFAQLGRELDEWNYQLAKSWLVDTGIIPESTLAQWRTENPHWVPNKRFFSPLEKRKQSSGAKKGFANQNNPVKAYAKEGSERDILDPIESLIEYTDKYVKTAKRNEVMQTIYRNLDRKGELEGFATVLKREPVKLDSDGGAKLIDSLEDEIDLARLKKNDLTKDNVLSTIIDGERVYMRIEDPDLLQALSNLQPQASNAVIETSRKLTNTMKALTTGINPVFGLTRNIFRDIPEGYIFSQTTNNPFRYAWDVIDGFVSVFADGAYEATRNSRTLQKVTTDSFRRWLYGKSDLYKDYKAVGGGHSSPAAADRDLLAQSKRSLLPQNRNSVSGVANAGLGVLENLNNALESGTRLGEFKRVRQSGGDTYGSRIEGLFKAQDVTTNFKRRGQVVHDLDAVIPYMNAAVQGLDKLVRSFKDQPVATVAKSLGAISLPTIALYAWNHDNPEYQKASNYNKDNFYLIPNADGKTFTKIAKPRELGVGFSALLERALRAWQDDDPEAFRDFADTAKTMFLPPLVSEVVDGKNPMRATVFGPLVEVDSNENFMGSPIVPQYLEGLSPRYQYDANTSEVGKKVGDLLNVSPKQVDHLIRSYTGVIGQLGLPATTQGASIGGTLQKQMTVDPAFSTDATSYFYDLKNKLDQQLADIKSTGEMIEGFDLNAQQAMQQVAGHISEYTKALREVDSLDISSKEKADIKRQLTSDRNDIARRAYEAVRDSLNEVSR